MCGPDDHVANADTERQYRTQPSLKPERLRVATTSGRLSGSAALRSSDSEVADLPREAASSVPDGALVVEPLALTFDGYTCECLHHSSGCMTPEAPSFCANLWTAFCVCFDPSCDVAVCLWCRA